MKFIIIVNDQKHQILTRAVWRLNFYHYLWLAYFSKWAVIMVVSTYYIFSFLIAITEVYPGSIKKPASVIAITAVAAPFKGFLHLILYRLSDVPKQYYTYIVWLLWAMGIIETLFKVSELLLIAKWIPNSEINTALDKWNVVGEVLKQLIVSVMCAWGFHRPQTIYLGNEGQHFEKINSRYVAPLLSRKEKSECLNSIYPYTDY